jgi:hypothetical protein
MIEFYGQVHMLELQTQLLGNANDRIWPGVSSLPNANLMLTEKFAHQP